MVRKHSLRLFITSILLIGSYPSLIIAHKHDKDDQEDSSINLIGAFIGGAAAVAGAYTLINWLTTASDEQVVAASEGLYTTLTNRYRSVLNDYEQDRANYTENNEALLESIAQRIMAEKAPGVYISEVRQSLHGVNKSHDELMRRIQKSKGCTCIQQDMQRNLEKLCNLKRALTDFVSYLTKHERYFKLYVLEQKLAQRYSRELQAYDSSFDTRDMTKKVRGAVMNYASRINSPYPYLAYIQQIRSDTNMLDTSYAHKPEYRDLLGRCRNLQHALEGVQQAVMSDDGYHRDLHNQERDRLDRQRLQLQEQLLAQNNRLLIEAAARRQRPKLVIKRVYRRPALRAGITVKGDLL